jgi:protein TonB
MEVSAALPGVSATARLAPVRSFGQAARARVMRIAIGAALLLHLVFAGLFFLRPPAFLVPAHPTAPPHEAEVELVQNDMPAVGDQSVGGTGKTNQHADPTHEAAPPPQPQPQAPPPPPTPDLPVASNGELPPPQPGPSSDQKQQPSPPNPAQQEPATTAPAGQPDPDYETAPIRLSTEDDSDGATGGSADQEAAADPKAHNKLPPYPLEAARRGEQGTVVTVIHVNPDGTAASVVVVQSSGSPTLDSTAVRTFQHWKFRPAQEHGAPVPSDIVEPLRFVNTSVDQR